jgi:hypothetical protein
LVEAEKKMSRLTQQQLQEFTGRQRGTAQVRWFREYLGANVPHDQSGPILTQQALEMIVARANGLRQAEDTAQRATVKLRSVR